MKTRQHTVRLVTSYPHAKLNPLANKEEQRVIRSLNHLSTRAGFGCSYIGGFLTTNFDIFFKKEKY